jgi:hypothetical protein
VTVDHTPEGAEDVILRAILVASEDDIERGGVTSTTTDGEIGGVKLRIDVKFERDPYERI